MSEIVGLQLAGRVLAPVAGRAIPGLLSRLTLGWRVARAVSKVAKTKGWRISRRELRRALATKQVTRELLQSDSQTYPSLISAAKAALIEPRQQAVVAELGIDIADEFVKALPDRDSIQAHTSRETSRVRADLRVAIAAMRRDSARRSTTEATRSADDRGISNLHLIPRSTDLIVRDDVQASCDDVLSRERLLVLVGPHGCGKSAVAGQLALSSDAGTRWWIDGHSDESLQLGAEALLAALDRSDGGSATEGLRRILVEHTDLLLIIDGIDDARRLHPVLPAGMRARVIVTTTDPLASPPSSAVEVGPFTTSQSVALFERLTAGPADEWSEDVERLVDALSGLPLAIRQAAAYVRASGVSPADLSDRLTHSSRRVLAEHAPSDYSRSLVTVHDLAREGAVWEEPAAAAVLALIAMSGPGGLTRQLLGVASSATEVDRALAALARNGLVQVSVDRAACHSITARLELESTRSRRRRYLPRRAIGYATSLARQDQLEHVEVVLPALTALFSHADYRGAEARYYRQAALALALKAEHPQSVVVHASAIRLLLSGKRRHGSELLNVQLTEVDHLVMLGMPGRALPLATQAIDLASEWGDSLDYVEALTIASLCNLQLGNRTESIELAERAATVEEGVGHATERRAYAARLSASRVNPRQQTTTLMSIRDTLRKGSAEWALQTTVAGRAFVEAGNPQRGLALSRQALAADRKLFDENSMPVARDMNDMGIAYIAMRDYRRAEDWLRRSLGAYESLGGDLHSHAGMPLMHLGRLYHLRSLEATDPDEREALRTESENCLRRALALNSAERSQSAELAATLVALGDTVQLSPHEGGREEALVHFTRALDIDRRQFADDNAEVIIDTLRVAGAHIALDQMADARSVLDSLTTTLSRSHDLPVQQAQALQMRIMLEMVNPDGSRVRAQGLARRLMRLERRNRESSAVARDIAGIIDAFPADLRAIAGAPDVE